MKKNYLKKKKKIFKTECGEASGQYSWGIY